MKTPNLHLNNGKYGRLLQRNIKYENVVLWSIYTFIRIYFNLIIIKLIVCIRILIILEFMTQKKLLFSSSFKIHLFSKR
jgi:hypothetical protein